MVGADLVLRWMHIFGAIILVGGTIFMRFVYLPGETSEELRQHAAAVRRRWSKLVMVAIGFLLISGLINFARILGAYEIADDAFPGNLYHAAFGVKFLLALVVFFLTSALVGRRNLAERLRQREQTWLTVNVVLAVLVVCLAGMMKLAVRLPKSEGSGQPSSTVGILENDSRFSRNR